jgi:hypothetical protein
MFKLKNYIYIYMCICSISKVESCLMEENAELLRPGFSRFSLPYTLTDTEVNYVIKAVLFVAKDGWKFLPQYRLDAKVLSLPFSFFSCGACERNILSSFSEKQRLC